MTRKVGRIRTYFKDRGYGFVRGADNKQILVSSYEIPRKEEKKICLGSLIAYDEGEHNGKPVATNVALLERYKNGIQTIEMPNGKQIPLSAIYNYGTSCLYSQDVEKYQREIDAGLSINDLNYLFIYTPKKEYHFFNPNSPYNTNHSQKNIIEYCKYLDSFSSL